MYAMHDNILCVALSAHKNHTKEQRVVDPIVSERRPPSGRQDKGVSLTRTSARGTQRRYLVNGQATSNHDETSTSGGRAIAFSKLLAYLEGI